MLLKFLLAFLQIYLSLEYCHPNCEECDTENEYLYEMTCKSCKEGLYFLNNTQACIDKIYYPESFMDNGRLYLCEDLFYDQHCYECDPYMDTVGNCLSCEFGYVLNEKTNICEKCEGDSNFFWLEDGCIEGVSTYCYLVHTCCNILDNCNLNISDLCIEQGYNKDCFIWNKNNKIIFVNFFIYEGIKDCITTPSYNVDRSGYLLIEFMLENFDPDYGYSNTNQEKRKLYFYNDEGRGCFDEINDNYTKIVGYNKHYTRGISTSIALKFNNSEEYKYLLNFESYNNNLELIDIKTGEIIMDNIYDILWIFYFHSIKDYNNQAIQILELNEDNQFLICSYSVYSDDDNYIVLFYWIFSLDYCPNEKLDFNILKFIDYNQHNSNTIFFNKNTKFFFIQDKTGNLFASFVSTENKLFILDNSSRNNYYIYDLIDQNCFQKLLLITNEIKLLCFFSIDRYFNFKIFDFISNEKINYIFDFQIKVKHFLTYDNTDIIILTEEKISFAILEFNNICIYLLNFFNYYKNYMINKFIINVQGNALYNNQAYSHLFKYKDILGIHFQEQYVIYGFILFGYYNSTDPKQIINLKKDGLNYHIKLNDYLNLQSNIFGYKIKCIKIIEVPDINKSGLYLISNFTKKEISKNECININTEIFLFYSYNGTLNKGNHLFKFAGVLNEPEYEIIQNNSDDTFWNFDNETLKQEYIEIYNNRRNMNITGKVALVQINVLNDTKVFCDKKYDIFALKSEKGQYLACGIGQFYDVENANEITQLNLGINYYFDYNKNCYIKCHEKCKTCSREFNNTNMKCDDCYEKYFLREGNCLEISECDYNYYYDINFNLKCINRDTFCPDFKPYENIKTKECIENCSILELNSSCSPTNNLIAINDTYHKIFNNLDYLNLKERLLNNKTKYTIIGNNVTFIFSTSEIEKNELYINNNYSSIILGQSENELKKIYLLAEELPIPILKIETLNNHSNNVELFYEFFNPLNFSQKLDLNLIPENFINIRIPIYLKKYKIDLISKTKNLGYNIFDLNNSFYNDICSIFTYNGSDITLSERKNIIDLSDEILCLNECNYLNYDIITMRSICLCKIGHDNNITDKTDSNNNVINSDNNHFVDLIKTNTDISKTSNIIVVKCFSKIFKQNLFTENYGFYIIFFLIIFNVIILVYFPISKIDKLLNEYCIDVLNKMKKIYNNKDKIERKLTDDDKKEQIIKNKTENIEENKKENINKKINLNIDMNNKPIIALYQEDMKKIPFNTSKNKIISRLRFNNINQPTSNLILTDNSKNDKTNLSLNNIIEKYHKIELNKDDEKEKKIIDELKGKNNSDYYIYYIIKNIPYEERKIYLSESEIDNLSYKNALQIENRTGAEYYFALLKEKNKIISIFFNDKDYNIQSAKILVFIFDFNLSLTINALFYNDETIYQINQQDGQYNLKLKIARVIYSSIISIIISFIIELLGFSHKSIIELRYYKKVKETEIEIPKLIKKIKLKYILFSCLTILFNIIFFYYISAFCAIYSVIQTHMISDSLISFLLTMSYSLILSIISTIIRVFSLKKENKLRHFFYLISWIISLI